MMGDNLVSKNRQSRDISTVSLFGGQTPISAHKTERALCHLKSPK